MTTVPNALPEIPVYEKLLFIYEQSVNKTGQTPNAFYLTNEEFQRLRIEMRDPSLAFTANADGSLSIWFIGIPLFVGTELELDGHRFRRAERFERKDGIYLRLRE